MFCKKVAGRLVGNTEHNLILQCQVKGYMGVVYRRILSSSFFRDWPPLLRSIGVQETNCKKPNNFIEYSRYVCGLFVLQMIPLARMPTGQQASIFTLLCRSDQDEVAWVTISKRISFSTLATWLASTQVWGLNNFKNELLLPSIVTTFHCAF